MRYIIQTLIIIISHSLATTFLQSDLTRKHNKIEKRKSNRERERDERERYIEMKEVKTERKRERERENRNREIGTSSLGTLRYNKHINC